MSRPNHALARSAQIVLLDYIWPKWRSDPEMEETPDRVLRAWAELFSGGEPLNGRMTVFPTRYTGIIARPGIPVVSVCAHHLAPYVGTVDVAYIANGKKLGISKIIRYVQHYSRVPSSQEELTESLVDGFVKLVHPKGVMLVFRAFHMCEATRGVRVANVPTVTSSVRGAFRTKPAARAEAEYLFRGVP
jgi:GTP cyclohydrolase IA